MIPVREFLWPCDPNLFTEAFVSMEGYTIRRSVSWTDLIDKD